MSTGNDDSFDSHTPAPLHQKGQPTAMRHQSHENKNPSVPIHSFQRSTMRRLPALTFFSLVFSSLVATDDLEDWDVGDLNFQQSQRRPFTHSNRTHSVSGAAFTPESTVILTTSMKATRVYVPFPETPALGNDFVKGMSNQLDSVVQHFYGSRDRYCDDTLDIGPHFPNFYNHALAELWRSINRFESDLDAIKNSVTVFVNNTGKEPLSRKRRWLATAIAAAATSTIFEPVIRKVGCAVLSPIGVCQDRRAQRIEDLYQQIKHLNERVQALEQGAWRTFVIEPPHDPTHWSEPILSSNVTDNERTLERLLPRLELLMNRSKTNNMCSRGVHKKSDYGICAIHISVYDDITSELRAMAGAIKQRRVALQSFGYLLHDALGSLVHGYLPTTLIPPDVLIKILQMTEKGILVEAIPRSQLSAYYSFELVRETYISDKGVHVLLEIPLHSSAGLHNVMRATPVPQPILGGRGTATQYRLRKSLLLLSWDRTNFAEVSEERLLAHCHGTGRLKLCKKPFATTVSQRTTCLTGLYFNLVSVVLKLCEQEVLPLPQQPQAEYLYDSTYLLTSADGNFLMQNFTEGEQARKIKGCQSCLIKPPCRGRIQLPSGGLVLRPDPETCIEGPENVVSILPAPQLGPIFGALADVTRDLPSSLISDLQGEILDHVRLNLAQLVDEDLTDEALTTVVEPFLEQIRIRHAIGIRWLFRQVLLPLGLALLSLSLSAGLVYLGRQKLAQAVGACISGCWHRRQRKAVIQTWKDIQKELEEEENRVPRISMAEEPILAGQTGHSGTCGEPEIAEADVHPVAGAHGAGLQRKSGKLDRERNLNCRDK